MNLEQSKSALVRYLLMIIIVILILGLSILKYPKGEVSYHNADATWHALLTMEAYDRTAISDHIFLPIVTLGEKSDKFISWGSTIPDDLGNYYYVSFSAATFFVPWAFFKIFGMAHTELSLYIFNTMLLICSALVWMQVIKEIFVSHKNRNLLSFLASLILVVNPQVLHSMGVVYWAQSLMQVLLPAQILAYIRMKNNSGKLYNVIFYLLVLLNPYVEWTGFMANAGFIFVEFFLNNASSKKVGQKRAYLIIGLSFLAICLFFLHYLLRVDIRDFLKTLFYRSTARGFSLKYFLRFIMEYGKSFLFTWLLLIFLGINHIFFKKKKLELDKTIIGILLIMLLENLFMNKHAISYSFDRMKMGFLLSYIITYFFADILYSFDSKKGTRVFFGLAVMSVCFLNVISYLNNKTYVYPTNYRKDNQKIAEYVRKNFPDSVIGMYENTVRGYHTLMFDRGVIELIFNIEQIKDYASSYGKRYALLAIPTGKLLENMSPIEQIIVIDTVGNLQESIFIKNGVIYREPFVRD